MQMPTQELLQYKVYVTRLQLPTQYTVTLHCNPVGYMTRLLNGAIGMTVLIRKMWACWDSNPDLAMNCGSAIELQARRAANPEADQLLLGSAEPRTR